jgi:Protein of unknown function (DUF2786)/SprT-like family
MNETHTRLTLELETAALRCLTEEWSSCNWSLFRERMQRPMLSLVDSTTHLARWVRATRTIEFARTTLTSQPWVVVLEILKHEMAHQYVDEVLGQRDETAHGPVFKKICEERGIDARAAGVPSVGGEKSVEETAVLDRIRKLLALAESPNEHEAQAAMNAAQRLMLKYNIDSVSKRTSAGYSFRQIGEPTGRTEEARRILARILTEHFFVEIIWVTVWRVFEGRSGGVIEACGTTENLEMAEYVYKYLMHTADALWVLHKRHHRITSDRDRRAYRAGVMAGFNEKLRTEQKANQEKGLVWVGDPELHSYYRKRFPRVSMVRSAGSGWSDAREHGREAGRNIVLHKGVQSGSSGGGGLLGPGGS